MIGRTTGAGDSNSAFSGCFSASFSGVSSGGGPVVTVCRVVLLERVDNIRVDFPTNCSSELVLARLGVFTLRVSGGASDSLRFRNSSSFSASSISINSLSLSLIALASALLVARASLSFRWLSRITSYLLRSAGDNSSVLTSRVGETGEATFGDLPGVVLLRFLGKSPLGTGGIFNLVKSS